MKWINVSLLCLMALGSTSTQAFAQQEKACFNVKVQSEEGTPLDAYVKVLQPKEHLEYLTKRETGNYSLKEFPKDPYVLEITAETYQPRIVFPGTDFQEKDKQIAVTLKKGPIPIGVSVWETVTGRPASRESVENTPLAAAIRTKEYDYYQCALQKTLPAPIEHKPAKVRFVDQHNQPLPQVSVYTLDKWDPSATGLIPPAPNAQPLSPTSEGLYELKDEGSFVASAPNLARVAIQPYHLRRDSIDLIALPKPCSIEFNLIQSNGQPARNVSVNIMGARLENGLTLECSAHELKRADERGTVSFSGIAPGTYCFVAGYDALNNQSIYCTVHPEENYKHTFTLRDKNTTHPLLAPLLQARIHWESNKIPKPKRNETWDETWIKDFRALPAVTQESLGKDFKKFLEAFCAEEFDIYTPSEINLILHFAMALGDDFVNNALQKIFIALPHYKEIIDSPHLLRDYTSDTPFAYAIAEINNDKSVPFFEKTAADTTLNQNTRIAALFALGHLHSKKSAAAFARLRKAAYHRLGIHNRSVHTHLERMIEAAMMTMYVIPGNEKAVVELQYDQITPYRILVSLNDKAHSDSAWKLKNVHFFNVAEDYCTGTFSLNNRTYHLYRVGEEWLVTSFSEFMF